MHVLILRDLASELHYVGIKCWYAAGEEIGQKVEPRAVNPNERP
jgi:hypothetical protein